MENLCEKLIATCIAADCENPVYAGVEQKGYLFNKADITGFVTDSTNGSLVTALSLASDAKGYVVQQLGKTPFTGTNTAMAAGTYSNKFTNTVNFVVMDNSAAASDKIIDNLANGKYVVVLENSYNGSDEKSKYQIYGLTKGLVANEISNDKYSEETDGGWLVSLIEEGSPKSGYFLHHETEQGVDDTKTYLDGMTNC